MIRRVAVEPSSKWSIAATRTAQRRLSPQPGLPAWDELFGGDAVVAAAILDRLLDGAAVINIKGGPAGAAVDAEHSHA